MANLPLTKGWHPADLLRLTEERSVVDQVGIGGQHWSRRWEYALALHAQTAWVEQHGITRQVVDVGGGGSPFWQMVSDNTVVIDPTEGQTLAEYLAGTPRLFRQVFCLSVLEHVEDWAQCVYHLGCLTAPGGLLFLTMDCRENGEGGIPPDDRHWHWLRHQIFTPAAIHGQIRPILQDFDLFGEADWTYHGPMENWGYSPFSLALVKHP